MPIPVFQPLPGQFPITSAEMNAIQYALMEADSRLYRTIRDVFKDYSMSRLWRLTTIRELTLTSIEVSDLQRDVHSYSEFLASEFVKRASRVCRSCDGLLYTSGYCPNCNATCVGLGAMTHYPDA